MERASPNSPSEMKPLSSVAPLAPLAAAIPSKAKIKGVAQAGTLSPKRTPIKAEPRRRDIWARLGSRENRRDCVFPIA